MGRQRSSRLRRKVNPKKKVAKRINGDICTKVVKGNGDEDGRKDNPPRAIKLT